MSFITDLITSIVAGLNKSTTSPVVPAKVPVGGVGSPKASPTESDQPKSAAIQDRSGTFIIPDVYPLDLGPNPPFHVLPNLVVPGGHEVIGCSVKATEATGWGATNEAWFQRSWRALGVLSGPQFFRECYHFLRFTVDGAKQADYFCDQVDKAGGWGEWDLMPMVDVEEGGQGAWAPGPLEKITDATERAKLAAEVTKCTTDFITRFKARTGLRIAVYGRGVFRDLQMTHCRFGADAVVDPAYTRTLVPMDQYGWPAADIRQWQACGDGTVVVPTYPAAIPAWGRTDYSIFLENGKDQTSLAFIRKNCLAKPQ
jgi:hypothetical protein